MARSRLNPNLLRYGLALAGPVGVAGSQFLVNIAMIHYLTPRDFGGFSFLMVANVLSWGICSALVCAPLPVLLYQRGPHAAIDGEARLVGANACFALAATAIIAALAWCLDFRWLHGALFVGYAWLSFLRYFARAHALAHHRQIGATLSDLCFAAAVLAALVMSLVWPRHGGTIVFAGLLAGAAMGLVPFGARFVFVRLLRPRMQGLRGYGTIWRTMSGWSVLGVITTEATNNAHAYLVTSILGPAAFAPMAASMLVTRPVSVVSTALSDFERPRLARYIGEMRYSMVGQSMRMFAVAIVAAWIVTGVAALTLFLVAPRLLFPPTYGTGHLALGAGLWMLVAAARLAALPPSCTLIACGEFKSLAWTSLRSGVLTIAAVAILLFVADSMWSICGVLLGQSVYAGLIFRRAQNWLNLRQDGVPVPD